MIVKYNTKMRLDDIGIFEGGERRPSYRRMLFSGAACSGKTTTSAEKFGRPFFISTDGNAKEQGYRGIKFDFKRCESHKDILTQFIYCLDIAERIRNTFDVLSFDLIDEYDRQAQSMLRDELENYKLSRMAWGKIKALYCDMHVHIEHRFEDKDVHFLTREEPIYKPDPKNKGEKILIGYKPNLRDTLKDAILKDQAFEIRCVHEHGKREYIITSTRWPEKQQELLRLLHAPIDFNKPKELTIKQKIAVKCRELSIDINDLSTYYNLKGMSEQQLVEFYNQTLADPAFPDAWAMIEAQMSADKSMEEGG